MGEGKYFAPDYWERLGHEFFGKKGKLVGEGITSVLNALGLGSYQIESNSLLQPGALDLGGEIPRIANDGIHECILVRKEEYIGDLITGSGTPSQFDVQVLDINPANGDLFPWLAQIASQFQEWKLRGMLVVLKTIASDVSTALSLGQMFGVVQYDVDGAPFTNMQQILNYQGASSQKVSKSVVVPVECKESENVLTHLFVATNGVIPTGKDPKFYNLAKLWVGSEGCPQANTKIAQIWVTYDIALYKSFMGSGGDLALGIQSGHWTSTTFANAAPLTGFPAGADPDNFFRGEVTSTTIKFPHNSTQGIWLVGVRWSGGSASLTAPVVTFTGCEAKVLFANYSSGQIAAPAPTTTATRLMMLISVRILEAGSLITFGGAGTLPTLSSPDADLVVTQLNGQFN